MASKSCALSLVRQLYHMGVIEAYTGQTKKKDQDKVRYIISRSWMVKDEFTCVISSLVKKESMHVYIKDSNSNFSTGSWRCTRCLWTQRLWSRLTGRYRNGISTLCPQYVTVSTGILIIPCIFSKWKIDFIFLLIPLT